jgi:aminoglycoside phosphotransferase (APT) family kinase protein
MEFVRSRGYPVPYVEEIAEGGTALVMERIDGPSMMQLLGRRPWQLRRQARVLAELHERLHLIEAPDWLQPAPGVMGGTALLHLDLHPLNVLVSGRGAVVIDWPRAARGDPAADVALTWILLESGQIPGPAPVAAVLGRFRSVFVRSFVAQFDLAAIRQQVPAMVDYKVQDENMSAAECRAMRRLAERVARH